ncbi:MAG: hypothetical protein ACOYM3_23455 [Terrimicrobiaceae bacterium]
MFNTNTIQQASGQQPLALSTNSTHVIRCREDEDRQTPLRGKIPRLRGISSADWSADAAVKTVAAKEFVKISAENKASHEFGASVAVYGPEKYFDHELFVVEKGGQNATVYVSPDGEIGGLTRSPGAESSLVGLVFECALATGNVKWGNCFDTVLPKYYAPRGFSVVARLAFDESQKPSDWDYDTYRKFNNGRPDVVFLKYIGTPTTYHSGEGKLVESYDAAVAEALRGSVNNPERGCSVRAGNIPVGKLREGIGFVRNGNLFSRF